MMGPLQDSIFDIVDCCKEEIRGVNDWGHVLHVNTYRLSQPEVNAGNRGNKSQHLELSSTCSVWGKDRFQWEGRRPCYVSEKIRKAVRSRFGDSDKGAYY